MVDSSVTPGMNWAGFEGLPGGAGGPDFGLHTSEPFVIEGTGNGGIIEIPVTIVPAYALHRRFPTLLRLYNSLPARAARRLFFKRWLGPQPTWLQPVHVEYRQRDMQRAFRYQSQTSDVTVMMLHSRE